MRVLVVREKEWREFVETITPYLGSLSPPRCMVLCRFLQGTGMHTKRLYDVPKK